MYDLIQQKIETLDFTSISKERAIELQVLINHIKNKKAENQEIALNFICTHNSRRSQFSQLWAKVASDYYNIAINCYSGGIEETAFNGRAVSSLLRFGFLITSNNEEENPIYRVKWNTNSSPLLMYSKLFDDKINNSSKFAAILTCSHADENCPFIPRAEIRIPIRYNDPKQYDDSPIEKEMYDTRSLEIATELFYVFSKV